MFAHRCYLTGWQSSILLGPRGWWSNLQLRLLVRAAGSMRIAVASLCQSLDVLSVSFTNSFNFCSGQIAPQYNVNCNNTAPFWSMVNSSPERGYVPLEKWLHPTISDTHPVPLTYKSSLGGQIFFPYREMVVNVVFVGLTWLYLWPNDCHSELVTQTEPFHKCWGFTVKECFRERCGWTTLPGGG